MAQKKRRQPKPKTPSKPSPAPSAKSGKPAEAELEEAKTRAGLGRLIAVVLAIAGVWLSASLVGVHMGGGSDLLAKVCGGEGGGGCDKVLDSKWSVFPPAAADAGAAGEGADGLVGKKRGGIPTAALGLIYFVCVAAWLVVIGFARGSRSWMNKALLGVVAVSCLGSLLFIIIMATVVKAWCPLCLGSHLANFGLLGTLFFFLPRGKTSAGSETAAAMPPNKLAFATVGLGLAVFFGIYNHYRAGGLAAENKELAALATDTSKMEMAYYEIERVAPDIRPDDPVIEAAPGVAMELVFWSDVECPSCARFDQMLFDHILPAYKGHLRVIYKHNPLSIHKNAFKAATALEAGRNQGKFWMVHHELMERRGQLATLDYRAFAGEIGLDADQFVADMESPEVADRIREDTAQLRSKYKTNAVPTVVFNQRKLTNVMRAVMGFWKTRIESLQRARATQNAEFGGSVFELASWKEEDVDAKVGTMAAERIRKPAPTPVGKKPPVKPTPARKPAVNTPKPKPAPVGSESIAAQLSGKLVRLSDPEGSEGLEPFDWTPPAKEPDYYLVYQSAHWCAPCRLATPRLVEFYNKTKPDYPNFEVIFLSSDKTPAEMPEYMKWGKMPWPAIRYSQRGAVPGILNIVSRSIPYLTLLDKSGNVLAASRSGSKEIPAVVNELQRRLGSPVYDIGQTEGSSLVNSAPKPVPGPVVPPPGRKPVPAPVKAVSPPPSSAVSKLPMASTVFDAKPLLASFGYLNSVDDKRSVVVTLKARSGEVEITGVTSPEKFFKAELITTAPGKEYRIKVDTVPPLPEGMRHDFIVLHTPDGQEDLQLKVMSAGVRPIKTEPGQIRLPAGALTAGQTKHTVKVVATGAETFSLTAATPDLEGVTAKVEEVEAGKAYDVMVEFPEGYVLPKEKRFGVIKLTTTHQRMPQVNVVVMRQLPVAPAAGTDPDAPPKD